MQYVDYVRQDTISRITTIRPALSNKAELGPDIIETNQLLELMKMQTDIASNIQHKKSGNT